VSIIRAPIAILALLAVLPARPAFGSGDERTTTGEDLTIRTDTRWAGGFVGGYLPIRVRVSNLGPPRDLIFEFEPSVDSSRGVRARRVIGIEQNATVHFTLSLPLVASRDGTLHVYEGARELKTHSRSISVPGATPMSPSSPAMLVITPGKEDCGRFVDASNHLVASTPAGRFGRIGTVDSSVLAEVVQSTLLPESWIDYSGLDFVAVSRDEFERLEHSARAAILKWVQSGGNLLFYEVGNDAQAMARVDRLIEAPEQAGGKPAWQSALPSERPSGEIKVEPADEETTFSFPGSPVPARIGRKKSSPTPDKSSSKPTESPWKGGKDAFRHRELMLGTVYAFPENPFPGTINDWLWLCKSCSDDRWSWTARHGMSPHLGTKDFYKFMNAGIHGVPTIAFLVLITVFSVAIGPVNYVYLSRKKMLWLLLFTVPVLAVTTSVLLLSYSVAIHGFSIKSRIRSLTVLDQRNRTAVTMARLALFAGVAPSGGMRFSPETAVFPVLPTTNEPTGGYVDWTQTQNLASGWLTARTRTQFLTVRNAEQRARVELKVAADKSVEFWNGLPWELEMLVVADDAGHLYVARSVAAGATAALAEPTADDLKQYGELLRRNAPALPPGFVEPTPSAFGGGRAWMTYAMRGSMTTDFVSNLMERRIERWSRDLPQKKGLAPRSYVAVVRENPGVETGVSSTSDQLSLHLLNGYF
jgi:hypothetical protein